MSKKAKEIKKALSHLGRGEFTQVIRLLEPKIPLFLENKEFYSILAKAFYYTGDYVGSKLYFDRGQKIFWDIESSLYLAVLGLKRRDFNSSIRIWLDILDESPGNIYATKGLEALKKYSTMEELETFIHSKRIDKLMPKKPVRLSPSTIISISVVLFLIIGTIVIFKSNLIDKILAPFKTTSYATTGRVGQENFILDSSDNNYLDFSSKSEYTFTSSTIEEYFKLAEELFISHEDNMVRRYLNLIKYSNANSEIKLQADRLESYLVDPNWINYDDNIIYLDVVNSTLEFEGCIVKWKGSISNMKIDNNIEFDLLVGYETKKVLDGVVTVVLNENILLDDSLPIEVLGKIKLNNNKFYIEAITVMQFVSSER